MIRFDKEYLFDRIRACWLGKNMGGTIGGPYEGTRNILDVQGFQTEPGDPLPNDDLDLQLVWLRAVDELGPEQINARTLGEYWTAWIGPDWNEYGVCKANMKAGIIPPISGEVANDQWRNSNGAWIRTEIWACLYPLAVDKAVKMAYEDACVDHGYGEGMWAALFVAAMESAAFAIHNIETLIEIGLSKIPKYSRVARSVRIAQDGYRAGDDWQTVRNRLVNDSSDIGWFQAPANIGFVILGLLYGEGDFKRSMLLATDCGDDTDCTAATVGAILGIMNGMAGIPEDWKAYIGDDIYSTCILFGHGYFPETCTELARSIMNLLPVTLRTRNEAFFEFRQRLADENRSDEYDWASIDASDVIEIGDTNDFSSIKAADLMNGNLADELSARSRYSFVMENILVRALVEFFEEPQLLPGGELKGKLTLFFKNNVPDSRHYELRYIIPEGWSVKSKLNLYQGRNYAAGGRDASTEFTVRAGEKVDPSNRIILEIAGDGHFTPLYIPIVITG